MAGIGTFAAMDAVMKALAIEMGAYNAILWRCLLALLISGIGFALLRLPLPEKTALRIHIWRGLIVSIMAFLFFWGLKTVPLAEAIALSFIAPLITLYLAAVMLKEHISRRAIFASMLGFIGAMIVVAGQLEGNVNAQMAPGIAAVLLAALLYAYNLILQRQQALLAKPLEIALFQNATIVGVYLCFAPWLAVIPAASSGPSLIAATLLSLTSLMLISWAYARAEAKTLLPVEYTGFVWGALFGWLFFSEVVTISSALGTALIVFGCLLALGESQAKHPDAEAATL